MARHPDLRGGEINPRHPLSDFMNTIDDLMQESAETDAQTEVGNIYALRRGGPWSEGFSADDPAHAVQCTLQRCRQPWRSCCAVCSCLQLTCQ